MSGVKTSLNGVEYWVYKNNNGKRKIGFSYEYHPSIKFDELQSVIAKEFPDTSPSKLLIKTDGDAWYFGGGSFQITVSEIE